MQDLESIVDAFYSDDIIEFDSLPHTDWSSLLADYSRFRIHHEDADGSGYELVYCLRDGLILRVLDLQFLRDNEHSYGLIGDYISFFFNLGGPQIGLEDDGDFVVSEDFCCLLYQAKSCQHLEYSRKGDRMLAVNIQIKKSLLAAEYFDSNTESIPGALLPIYRDGAAEFKYTFPFDAEVKCALQSMIFSDYTGSLRDRFIEAKSVELICLLMRALQREERSNLHSPISERESDLLEQVRSALVADLSSPPSVEELALQVGMGKLTLLNRFKQVYGVTLRNYLLQRRMEGAKTLLLQKNLSPKQVAWKLGYGHACNFATAFKSYYGLTPSAYRKLNSIN